MRMTRVLRGAGFPGLGAEERGLGVAALIPIQLRGKIAPVVAPVVVAPVKKFARVVDDGPVVRQPPAVVSTPAVAVVATPTTVMNPAPKVVPASEAPTIAPQVVPAVIKAVTSAPKAAVSPVLMKVPTLMSKVLTSLAPKSSAVATILKVATPTPKAVTPPRALDFSLKNFFPKSAKPVLALKPPARTRGTRRTAPALAPLPVQAQAAEKALTSGATVDAAIFSTPSIANTSAPAQAAVQDAQGVVADVVASPAGSTGGSMNPMMLLVLGAGAFLLLGKKGRR